MFLHSGASLHGHEYSSRPPSQPGQRRNPLLRSALAAPINRSSSYHSTIDSSLDEHNLTNSRRARPLSEHIPRVPGAVVRFQVPPCDSRNAKPEAMSEDESSIASDSDASRASSSARRARRRAPRKSTTFLLAHPPPKLRNKQRLIQIRPKLLLQMQQLAANKRPRPAIDVYPSFAVAGPLIVPLLKRFPLIARIKRELGIQDVMLVKSEDYATHASGSESDGDEDDLKSRELLAILSPVMTEDKAEIVLADGTVWVATPRFNGPNSCSYEFVSVDSNGNTITARWVRKQMATKSLPITPTSQTSAPTTASAVECKFTFSIIDPNCRRHPIMATLTNSSLEILDSYTTVSQSASRYPPTSPLLSAPVSPGSEESSFGRTTQRVEDWQKTFISISAVWVILRHGWSPNWNPADFGSPSARIPTSPTSTNATTRNRSSSMNLEMTSKVGVPDPSGRRRFSGALRIGDQCVPGMVPRRATFTGAGSSQSRKTTEAEGPDQRSRNLEQDSKNKGVSSGDLSVSVPNRTAATPSASMLDTPPTSRPISLTPQRNSSSLTPSPLSSGRRSISAPYSANPQSLKPVETELGGNVNIRSNFSIQDTEDVKKDNQDQKVKHQKWKNMTQWFRKLQGR